MIYVIIAFRNVIKNWRHSLSALLSLSAAFVSLVLFDGYMMDLRLMYEDSFRHRQMLGDLIIEKPLIHSKEGLAEPWKFSITKSEQSEIENFLSEHKDLVSQRVRFLNFQGMITNGMQSAILMGRGFDLDSGLKVRGEQWGWNATYGVPLHKSDSSTAVLLGQGLARRLGCRYVKPKNFYTFKGGYSAEERPFDCPNRDLQISLMTPDGQLNAIDLQVVGLFDAGYKDIDDRYANVSLDVAQILLNTDIISSMSVELKKTNLADQFIRLFNEKINQKFPDIEIKKWIHHPVGETYLKTMDLLNVFKNFVTIVILVISTLSVANTLIKLIKERSREIGTLRSIGYKSSQVIRIFFAETFFLTLVGTLFGTIIVVFLTLLLNFSGIRYKAGMLSEPVLFRIEWSPMAYLNALAILVAVSLITCLVTTYQSVNKKIIDNLTHV